MDDQPATGPGSVEELVDRATRQHEMIAQSTEPDLDSVNEQRVRNGLEPLPDDYEIPKPQVVYRDESPLVQEPTEESS